MCLIFTECNTTENFRLSRGKTTKTDQPDYSRQCGVLVLLQGSLVLDNYFDGSAMGVFGGIVYMSVLL